MSYLPYTIVIRDVNSNKNISNPAPRRSFFMFGFLAFSIIAGIAVYQNADALYKTSGSSGSLTEPTVPQFPATNDTLALGKASSTKPKSLDVKTGSTSTTKNNPPPPKAPAPSIPPPTPAPIYTSGESMFAVSFVPLLTGGIAHAGKAVPISYLQITNTSNTNATLSGFTVKQTGSAPTESIIGLTTVDDKGGSRGTTDVIEGSTPFKDGVAFAPTNALFAPGQMKLFTIKAILSANTSSYVGRELRIDVLSVEGSVKAQGAFPIHGTTWTIAN